MEDQEGWSGDERGLREELEGGAGGKGRLGGGCMQSVLIVPS